MGAAGVVEYVLVKYFFINPVESVVLTFFITIYFKGAFFYSQ